MSAAKHGGSRANAAGGIDSDLPAIQVESPGAEHPPRHRHGGKEAAMQTLSDRLEGAGHGATGKVARQEARMETGRLRLRGEELEQEMAKLEEVELEEFWKRMDERERKREEERSRLEEERRTKRWLKWYFEVGIHRDFARDYARHMARVSC